MGLKFVIEPDHIPVNNYRLLIVGLTPITFTSIGSLERELDWTELPDRTQASTGRTKPGETEVKVPMHHTVQINAMEQWYQEGQDPISPTYKKTGTLTAYSGTTLINKTFTLIGVFNCKEGKWLSWRIH
jgi:hypothetical protein